MYLSHKIEGSYYYSRLQGPFKKDISTLLYLHIVLTLQDD
jgi:hypothetical protein